MNWRLGSQVVCTALVTGLLGGSKIGQCIPPGDCDLFARRTYVSGDVDGGALSCPVQLEGTLKIGSSNDAHVVTSGGASGDCKVTYLDYRPQYDC